MNIRSIMYKIDVAIVGVVIGLAWSPAIASADTGNTTPDSSTSTSTTSTSTSTNDAARLQNIINKGNMEIQRRLENLSKLQTLINSSDKLSSTEKSSLIAEITSTSQGLTSLKTQLDAATTISAAQTDVQNIVSEYRVYVLVDPKMHLLKVADDQQVTETQLTGLSTKLQTRITAAQTAGQTVTNLSALLTSMNSSINAAQTISSSIEASVSGLQPTDYNSNHNVLEGDNTQLQIAKADIQAAYNDAKQIIAGLESLKTTSTSSASTNTTN